MIASLPCAGVVDRRFLAWSGVWAAASLVAFGLVSAIIPNPVFGRQIPPEPFAIGVWLLSAPLMGLVLATYTVPAPYATAAPLGRVAETAVLPARQERDGSIVGTLAGFGAFLAIGCPVCNKIALVLLGTSGALSIYAPLQPVIGAVSIALLAGTLGWRMRQRIRGGACAT